MRYTTLLALIQGPGKNTVYESLKVVEINGCLQKIISNFPGCDTCTYIRIPKKAQIKIVFFWDGCNNLVYV